MGLRLFKGSSDFEKLKQLEVVNKEYELESTSSAEKLDHVFQDPVLAEHYYQLYEACDYECKDYFDPEFSWTEEEEKRVVWKNDWYVTFWAFLMFTALDIDRYNISQALSDNMLEDLGLTTNDFNVGKTINLVCFLAAELPSQLISKKIGPDIWIPSQIVLWSAVSMAQGAIKGKAGFFITRGLLGALQGGFICDICLWMSYFYTSKEFPFRLSLFYIANPMSSVWSSLLAFALLKIKTNAIPHGWKWLFIIEGALTLLVGLISFFKMPASAVQTKAWFRKKGWYTEREEKIIVNRVLRDDPTKGDMNNRQPVTPKELVKSLLDYDLWPIYIVRILGDIGASPTNTYMTLTLRKLGFSTFNTNLLTIPFNVLTVITMLTAGYLSEVLQSRALVLASIPVWLLACLFPLRYWPGSQINVWGTYAILTILLGACPLWPLSISWCSANSNSVRNRAVSAAVVNMFLQSAGIISANIYRADDAPAYHRGNVVLIGCAFGALGACILARYYYIFRNKQKDRAWNTLTIEQQEDYIKNTTDEANKRLDFKFVY